ncbi:3-oxoacyl-ACP synthase [Pseudothermotoga thermarum]|uniref:Beta-ketoacyl-acyl-carrier-protein synthase III n=1 Tax=Pseudothermotoga thermarum DSM 5069 TaxID=688269 RepID=F7YUB8_9THEM|nr:3-oxoacyl-ACP synthase [Pseudothermotoga thermarum]AEH51317.1 Beta-ketoacyl-acyl-carrier-protein synthase III [Pseudothermotoga thermarum DSM 5069]
MRDHVGILSIGTYLPSRFLTAKELAEQTGIPEQVIVEKMGIKKKYIPGPNDTTSFMGIMAAREAIKRAEIDPKEIDVVIWNGAQHKDYPCWLASTKVAYEIGATKAWTFDMEAMCGSMIVGLQVARSLMLSEKDINTVILVSGYRNVDLVNAKNKATSFMFDIGTSGSAAIIRKNLGKNVILGISNIVDGSFAEDCIIPVGGTKKWPMVPEDLENYFFQIKDPESFKERLSSVTLKNFYFVIDDALRKSNLSRKDIDYLAILHFKRSAHYEVLKELGLDESKTTYLEEYGHMGQNDQIFSIEEGLKSGKIKEGSVVVLVGAGVGWTWNAAVVRWGKAVEPTCW